MAFLNRQSTSETMLLAESATRPAAASYVRSVRVSKDSIRVGFDARWYNDSGVGTYVAELLRAMAAAQREFELVIYEDPQNPVPGLDGLPVVRIPARSPRYSLSEQWEFPWRARKDQLALFHSPFYVAPLALGCPLVITIHDLIPFLFPVCNWPKRKLIRSGHRIAATRARHVITVSESTGRDVKTVLKGRTPPITAVPLAARECFQPETGRGELERLRARYDIQPPYVVVPSARNWRTKNLESALRALTSTRQHGGVEFQTVVFGPREGIDAISPAVWGGLNLRIPGYVDRADLAALFRNAHAFIIASLYEGFGLPLVEAMACGCAVVSSNGGSLAEVAGNGAQVFSPFDVGGMGTAVARLLLVPEELGRWRRAALVRAADFCWGKTAAKTMSIYHQVVKESRTARVAATT